MDKATIETLIRKERVYRSRTSTSLRAVLRIHNPEYRAGADIRHGPVVVYIGVNAGGRLGTPGRVRLSTFEKWAGRDVGTLDVRLRQNALARCKCAFPDDFA